MNWAVTCATHGLPAQAALHVAYAGLAAWGLVRWARRPLHPLHPMPPARG